MGLTSLPFQTAYLDWRNLLQTSRTASVIASDAFLSFAAKRLYGEVSFARKIALNRLHRLSGLDRYQVGFGAWPSGKAAAFGAAIRRFESCRPSQPVHQINTLGDRLLKSPVGSGD